MRLLIIMLMVSAACGTDVQAPYLPDCCWTWEDESRTLRVMCGDDSPAFVLQSKPKDRCIHLQDDRLGPRMRCECAP